jgi:hypothetical protein
MYKATINPHGEPTCIIRTTDGACIPFDPANTDYQQYLAWLAEGNEPMPADDQGAQQVSVMAIVM